MMTATQRTTHRTAQFIVRAQAGFTLIETLIVMAFLALLLTLVAPRLMWTGPSEQEETRAQQLSTLRDAIDRYRADQGRFPSGLEALVRQRYLPSLPLDPVTGSRAWTELAHPGAADPGVHDVAPPVQDVVLSAQAR